jgi:enterochelin esterase family protein
LRHGEAEVNRFDEHFFCSTIKTDDCVCSSIGIAAAAFLAVLIGTPLAWGTQGPEVISPEVAADRRVTFRLLAPEAHSVQLRCDIPGAAKAGTLTKGPNGVWTVTIGPIEPGAYRYTFDVDGAALRDPCNTATSESYNNIRSLVCVPGSEFMDTHDVPHGTITAATYHSQSLGHDRRMHVYTPPGYEASTAKYPVLYLLHGFNDTDNSWPTVGRAGVILDNLIVAQRAVPMIVVMPAGHTTSPKLGGQSMGEEFERDFTDDIMPYVAKNYRVYTDGAHRAIAGLSRGGKETLHIAIPHIDQFAYIGVFSAGLIDGFGRKPTWEEQHLAVLDNPELKKGLKLLWFKTGREDGLLKTTRLTVDVFRRHGFEVVFQESPGGHHWINWRKYLIEFAPLLFQ